MFDILSQIDAFFWSYLGFSMIALLGCYFTIKTRFFQIRALPTIFKTFAGFVTHKETASRGTHPLKVFFASVGGMVGVGNIVGIVTALQIGGPGAIFWVWIAAFLGSLIKYSEVFLGLKYRVPNERGGYDGGSIYFLKQAFKLRWITPLICVLLCIYGAEIYQFSVLTHSIATNWHVNQTLIAVALLALVLYSVIGGINRVGKICAYLAPGFILLYLGMSLWVIGHHLTELPSLFNTVIKSAFTGHAALGGFAGSTLLIALQNGIARSAYSADLGIGFDSIIQSETNADRKMAQARLSMLGVFIDNLICICTLFVALCTGLWKTAPQIDTSLVIQNALSLYFPGQVVFMPIFLFFLVYTTLIAYLFVGLKCARKLHPRHGGKVYLFLSSLAFLSFTFLDQSRALLVMSLAGCLLLVINLLGIFRLRKEIEFTLSDESFQNIKVEV